VGARQLAPVALPQLLVQPLANAGSVRIKETTLPDTICICIFVTVAATGAVDGTLTTAGTGGGVDVVDVDVDAGAEDVDVLVLAGNVAVPVTTGTTGIDDDVAVDTLPLPAFE
jgi:hypothetical protein